MLAERSELAVIAPSADGSGLVAWLENLSKDDVPRAGIAGANLGELTRAACRCRPFVVTSDAYLRAMEAGGVRAGLLDEVAAADVDDPPRRPAAARLQDLVHWPGCPTTCVVRSATRMRGWASPSRSGPRRPLRTRRRRRSRA